MKIEKINKAFKEIGFIPSRPFNKEFDYHLIRYFDGRRQVIKLTTDFSYPKIKYVFDVNLEIYFDEVDAITSFGNERYQRYKRNNNANFELDFLHIPVVDFSLDFIQDTYANKPMGSKLQIDNDDALAWLIELYDWELKDFFETYSDIEMAEKSLEHPKSFYNKWGDHWNKLVLLLFFAAKKSKIAFVQQLRINEEIYAKSNSGFKINLPIDIYENYIQRLKDLFGYQ